MTEKRMNFALITKITGIFLIGLITISFILMVIGRVSSGFFWFFAILTGIYAYFILPKLRKVKKS